MHHVVALVLLGALASGCPAAPPPPPPPEAGAFPPPEERARIDAAVAPVLEGAWVSGLVVGLADSRGPRVYAYGTLDGDSVVELGSATEVFTGLLLADAVERGLVALDDPVCRFLPPEVAFPEEVTLRHLVTHTAGLPRRPDNFAPTDLTNPYVDYTVEKLHEYLGRFRPETPPGETFAVSNLGIALLAQVLAPDYEATLRERILEPLGMPHTGIAVEGLAQGHDGDLVEVGAWDFGAFAGAGGLRSSTNDLLALLGANLGYLASPLDPVLAATRMPQTERAAFGWQLMEDGSTLWRTGQTGGCRSFLALDPVAGLGVVVLSDTSSDVVDQIGRVALGQQEAVELRPTVELSTYLLDLWVGRYRLERGLYLEVEREEDHLVLISPDEPPARLYAASPIDFYVRVSDLQLTFKDDALVLHRPDGDQTARRARR
ncbi:MAG: beta-lactamase family protein [Deltaproteobacteria bacterium]|nr:beta-lactamase family protein [Deltaproteobacteria bacterium]